MRPIDERLQIYNDKVVILKKRKKIQDLSDEIKEHLKKIKKRKLSP